MCTVHIGDSLMIIIKHDVIYDMCDSLLILLLPITISRLPLSCWSFIAAGGKGLYFMNRMIALGDLMKLGQILRLQYFLWIHIQVIFPAVISYTELTEMVSIIIISPGVRCQIRCWWISNDCIWCVLYIWCIILHNVHKPKLLQNFAS